MTGALVATAIFALPLISAFTVLAYLADFQVPGLASPLNNPVNLALVAGAFLWLAASALLGKLIGPRSVNRSSFSLLEPRIDRLDCLFEQHCKTTTGPCKEACCEAKKHLDWLKAHVMRGEGHDDRRDSGVGWVLGFSYIDAWRRLHRAEEALLSCEQKEVLASRAKEDYLRIKGSSIDNQKELIANLMVAVRVLNEKALKYFDKDDWKDLDQRDYPSDETEARSVLATVRRSVNEYRDGRHSGVVNARNILALSAIALSVVGYAILALAVESGAPKPAMVAAVAFFLAGALGGLFDRIRSDAKAETSVDDYGLSLIRIIQTPIVSGLAGVAGIVLAEFLADALSSSKSTSTTSLGDLFDVAKRPAGLAVAAVFGATPSLISNILTKKADQYLKQIASSDTADGTGSTK